MINQGNLDAIENVVDHGFIDHIPQPVPGQPTQGPDAMHWFGKTARTAIPDLEVSVEDVVASGDKVVTRVTWRGTQQGPLLGADPTGKGLCFTGIDISRVSGGKILEHWGQVDVLAVLSQLGFFQLQ